MDRRTEDTLDQLGLPGARCIVRVDQRRLEVPVTHPLLKGSHRDTGPGHACSERMPEIVEARHRAATNAPTLADDFLDRAHLAAQESGLEPLEQLRAINRP